MRNEVSQMRDWNLHENPRKKIDDKATAKFTLEPNHLFANLLTEIFNELTTEDDAVIKVEKEKNKKDTTTKTNNQKAEKCVTKDVYPRKCKSQNNKQSFIPLYIPDIKCVEFADPYTVVWFEDGSKSVAVAGHGDIYDKETGLAICMLKRVLGNKKYRTIMNKYCYIDDVNTLN